MFCLGFSTFTSASVSSDQNLPPLTVLPCPHFSINCSTSAPVRFVSLVFCVRFSPVSQFSPIFSLTHCNLRDDFCVFTSSVGDQNGRRPSHSFGLLPHKSILNANEVALSLYLLPCCPEVFSVCPLYLFLVFCAVFCGHFKTIALAQFCFIDGKMFLFIALALISHRVQSALQTDEKISAPSLS